MSNPLTMKMLREANDLGCFVEQMQNLHPWVSSAQEGMPGSSLVVQWIRLEAPTSGGVGSVPGWGTKIPHAAQGVPPKKECLPVIPVVISLAFPILYFISIFPAF